MKHLALGNVNITRVIEMEGEASIKPQHLLPDATSEVIESHKHWLMPNFLTPDGMFLGSIHTYVIRTKHHTIVVDTCVGNDKARAHFPGWSKMQGPYLQSLEQTGGIKPEQVDYVLCTHMNADHVGWNTRLVNGTWIPTFPNAKYLFVRKEWEFWKQKCDNDKNTEDGSIVDSVIPVIEAGKAVLVECDHRIDDQVFLEPTPGHTPGHVCVHVKGGGKDAVMSGDIMHHPVQAAEPEWSSSFCIDPKAAAATRRTFLERHADTGRLILAAHFPTPTLGTIISSGNTFRFKVEDLSP
jgi:glyoxylase-like metal-dependent hydrolase (beta-lactamase superfamily II)